MYLDFIDGHRYDGRAYSNRGAKPRLRTRRRYIESGRDPVLQLPRSFYDGGWLRMDSDQRVDVLAEMLDDNFDWPDLRRAGNHERV